MSASPGTMRCPPGRRPTGPGRTCRASPRGEPPSGVSRRACSTAGGATAPPTPAPCSRLSRPPAPAPRGSSPSAGWRLRTRPPASASSALNTRPVPTHSIACEMPTTRGRNQLEQASVTIPRRANTKPIRALSAARRTSIGKGHGDAHAHGRSVDRRDHELLAVEDAQREHAATVPGHLLAAVLRHLPARLALAPVEGLPTALQVRARAEPAALAGVDATVSCSGFSLMIGLLLAAGSVGGLVERRLGVLLLDLLVDLRRSGCGRGSRRPRWARGRGGSCARPPVACASGSGLVPGSAGRRASALGRRRRRRAAGRPGPGFAGPVGGRSLGRRRSRVDVPGGRGAKPPLSACGSRRSCRRGSPGPS